MFEERDRDEKPRSHLLSKERQSIFCLNHKGFALPGETIFTEFVFHSKEHIGVIAERWHLEFMPPSKIHLDDRTAMVPVPMQGLQVAIRGHSSTCDTSITLRTEIKSALEYRTVQSFFEEIIYSCLRRVRTPLRVPELNRRKLDIFHQINTSLLHGRQSTYITLDTIASFFDIYQHAKTFIREVETTRYELNTKVNPSYSEATTMSLLNDAEMINRVQVNRSSLFPETVLVQLDSIETVHLSIL